MAWREWTPMEERIRFVMELERGSEGMSGLCRKYGISRKTGYKWLFRYREEGLEGLKDRLRGPHRIPHKTPLEVENLVVEERVNHPTWGPKKLAYVLKTKHGIRPPAKSTIGEILKRRGMIVPRRTKASVRCWPHTLKEAKGPNDLWSADFKGWFRTADRSKCHPLTISDRFSRYVLCCRIVERPDYSSVSAVFEEIFKRVGLPGRIRVDNGTPFGCPEAGRLSRLGVDWLKVGVDVEYIQPGRPEQNGRHERMHLTLKKETADPPAVDPLRQQLRFDQWVDEFNHRRPHEALGQVPPGQVWERPKRNLEGFIPDFEYPSHWESRRVGKRGLISWEGRRIPIGKSYYNSTIGLKPEPDLRWSVFAGSYYLGLIDGRAKGGLIRPPSAPER